MPLPKYHETFIPILKVLSDGKTIPVSTLLVRVRDEQYPELTPEMLAQRTRSGHSIILNRISWGKTYLKQGKLLDQPERAMVRITDKGKHVLEKGTFTLEDLKNDPDFKSAHLAYLESKKARKGEEREENGIAAENASPEDMIDNGMTIIERQVKSELLERLKTIDPYYFEKVVLRLLDKMGYGEPIGTPKSCDGGIDGIINQDQLGFEKIYMQAKRYCDKKVHEKEMRDFVGAIRGNAGKGVFVTVSTFDEEARQRAYDAPHKIILIDGEALVDLMYKYGIGVQTTETYEIKELDEDFFAES